MLRNAVVVLVLLAGLSAFGQAAGSNPQSSASPTARTEQRQPALRPDPARQMQMDLDQMDSLVNNMATQTSFIRDTNMSILLNTNVRLWTILLRDMRLQLQEQQKQTAPPK